MSRMNFIMTDIEKTKEKAPEGAFFLLLDTRIRQCHLPIQVSTDNRDSSHQNG